MQNGVAAAFRRGPHQRHLSTTGVGAAQISHGQRSVRATKVVRHVRRLDAGEADGCGRAEVAARLHAVILAPDDVGKPRRAAEASVVAVEVEVNALCEAAVGEVSQSWM